MAINLSQAFHRTAPAPIDDSLVLSKAEMLAVNDNLMPAKYFAICSDDGGIYLYDKAAEPSAETGKYTKFEGGGGGETGGGSLPIGALLPMTGNAAPRNCLVCDGTVYNIADYPLLAAYYKSSLGSANFYGGDGTTTFAVPDLRGEFIRGTGTNSHTMDGDGGNVGVHQDGTRHALIYDGSNVSGFNKTYITSVPSIDNTGGNIVINPQLSTKDKILSADNYGDTYRTRVEIVSTFNSESGDASSHSYSALFTSRPTNTSVLYCVVAKRSENEEIGSARILFEYDPDTESKTGTEIAQEFLSIVNSLSPNQRFTIGWVLNDGGMYLYQNDITSGDYAGGYGLSCAQIEKSGNENMKYLYVTSTAIVYEVYKLARTNNSITYQRAEVNMSSKFTAKLKIVDISGGASSPFNYSTTEQRVGTWVDGKPLYQRTFQFTTCNNDDTEHIITLDASIPVKDAFIISGYVEYTLGAGGARTHDVPLNTCVNPFATTAASIWTCPRILAADNSTPGLFLQQRIQGSGWSNKTAYVTMQYTKTTD